jgi:A/G-specific adenine glycosylase
MTRSTTTPRQNAQIKPSKLLTFHLALQHWYRAHGRHELAWRKTRDPYAIWVSEIMLQQTQVATVRDRYYEPFLKKFPTLEALAAAPREAVMKAWEGLGYYRRAAHLHEAAKRVSGFRVQVPALLTETWNPEPDTLLTLPGIGRNTAHAILAFAYHQPVAVMEANVKRVVARVFALAQPKEHDLWLGAQKLLNMAAPFDHNQAMMDLGALICTPKAPRCGECPAASICKGKSQPEHYPAAKAKKKIPTRRAVILVREDTGGRLYLEKRKSRLLGGLYGFPQHPPEYRGGEFIGRLSHVYSHFRLAAEVRREQVRAGNSPDWHSRNALASLPLSRLDRNVLKLLQPVRVAHKNPARRKVRLTEE